MPDDQIKSEDQLLEQWNFLDAMLAHQAAQLAGDQDRELDGDDSGEVVPLSEAGATPAEVTALRQQVADLDAECQTVMAEVHIRTLRVMQIMREHAAELSEVEAHLAHQKQLMRALRERHRVTVAKLRQAKVLTRELRAQLPHGRRRHSAPESSSETPASGA